MNTINKFPDNFLWGTATASHQVEGNNFNNDWWLFEQEKGNIFNSDTSKTSTNHYNLYEKDFELAKSLNNNSHRFSIEWSKIQPSKNEWNKIETEHYEKLLDSLIDKGLKPMITLHHFTNPIWIYELGGWENNDTIKYFCEYVGYIVDKYKKYTDLWITINEPNVYGFQSYDIGIWPPKVKNRNRALQVIINLLIAHAKSYKIIHNIQKNAKVSIAQHFTILDPKNIFNPFDYLLAYIQEQLFNYKPIDFLITGKMKIKIPTIKYFDISEDFSNTLDFIGVNYYTRYLVSILNLDERYTKENSKTNDLNWEIYPFGLYRVLMNLKKYNLPIYITENGIADEKDEIRENYLIEHLKMILKALNQGIDIRGYFHWTLMDNFEWAEGYKAKFGLFKVDFESPDRLRTKTKTAETYSKISKSNLLNIG